MTEPSRPQRAEPHTLPPRPNLDHLKNEAKSRLKALRLVDPAAKLAAAQLAVARDYGFSSWRSLRAHLMKTAADHSEPGMRDAAVAQRYYEQSRPRQEIAIDPRILDRYVGDYQLSSTAIFTVTRQGDRLFTKLTGQHSYPAFPESETKFFYKIAPAQISFTCDDTGRAVMLTLHQNGYERASPRIAHEIADKIAQTLTQRFKQGTPIPGTEAALRRQIDAIMHNKGEPDYSAMTLELENISRPQVSTLKAQFAELGALQSVAFLGVGRRGWDIYQAEFENGASICRILLNQDGKVEGLLFQEGP